MPRWVWIATDVDGTPRGELVDVTSRTITWRLEGAHDTTLTINGRSPRTNLLDDLHTDLTIHRDRQLLYRGRVGGIQDQADADDHTLTVPSASYRAVLDRRILYDDLNLNNEDETDIAWAVIQHIQSQDGGDYGITNGTTPTGTERSLTFPAGKSAASCLDLLQDLGLDWDITPQLELALWDGRGEDRQVTLDYGGIVQSFSRTPDVSRFANAVRATGDNTLNAETREDTPIPPRFRWDRQDGDTDIETQDVLSSKADRLIGEYATLRHTWQVDLKPGRWNPDRMWLGDTVGLAVRSGRLDVNTRLRIYEITVRLGESGEENVTLTLDRPQWDLTDQIRAAERRIAQLERQVT